MANRRMFAKTVVETDAFYDMPTSAQALYFHLGMNTDDDGFISNAKVISAACGAKKSDITLLISKGFLIKFDSGVIVIRHWRESNYTQNDRYHPTLYKAERQSLQLVGTTYELCALDTKCMQNGYSLDTELTNELNKDNYINNSAPRKNRNIPSSVDEVWEYAQKLNAEKSLSISLDNCETFLDYYTARGWNFNKGTPIKDWQSAFRNWVRNSHKFKSESPASNQASRKTLDREKKMLADLGIKV